MAGESCLLRSPNALTFLHMMFIESICVQISPNEDYFDYRTAQYHSIVLFG